MSGQAAPDAPDEAKLAGDNGELHMFRYLSGTERWLEKATVDDLRPQQAKLEEILVKVILAQEPFPPGRPLRNIVSRCFIAIYSLGETRTLYDTLQTFLRLIGDHKATDRDIQKTSALYCVGELMEKFGSQLMSLMGEIAHSALRILKSSSSSLLRYHALMALQKSLRSARKAVMDVVAKDIVKQARNTLTDKSMAVQRAACEVLIAMYASGDVVKTVSEVDSLITICTRSLDNADQVTRHSLARLVGHVLAATQIEQAVSVPEAPKKSKKERPDEEEDAVSPTAGPGEVMKALLTPSEMFLQLSNQLNRPQSTRKTRVGIFEFYAATITALGTTFAESNYGLIVNHLMVEVISHSRYALTHNRSEKLLSRRLVEILLRDLIGVRMLSEQAQIGAIQDLSNGYLRRWPALMPGQTAPDHQVLTIALSEVAGLLQQLGSAPVPVQDALAEPLITLLSHSKHTVRVHAAWALRCFCHSAPTRLPKALLTVLDLLQRDINVIATPTAPSDIGSRSIGHAVGLAALVAVIPERPLYVSYDITAKILDVATQLLKRAGQHDVKVAGAEVEIAWTLIASLMTLGPNFVRAQLPQLLVLWRNALPKPTSKDTSGAATRSAFEWMFLLHVRESALGAILCFLTYNSPTLVTLDVARRVASLLGNALSFANTFITQNVDPEPIAGINPSLQSREALLRRRIYQCFSVLGFAGVTDSTQAALLQSVVSLFASPDGYAGSSMQAAIASSSGTFTSVWQTMDGYAYGVTHIDIASFSESGPDGTPRAQSERLNRDNIDNSIHELLSKPILTSIAHDPLRICAARISSVEQRQLQTSPPDTAVVDASIQLFSQLLPIQDAQSASRVLGQLAESVKSPKLERNSGRKAAVTVNAVIALVLALRTANTSHQRRTREVLGSSQVTSVISTFLKDAVIDGDAVVRAASSEAIGRLASFAGTNFLTAQIKTLVDQVVSNRDPHGRAGCALAFGAIYEHVGGLAAGPLLKTTVNVLISLSQDPHPIVHYWALSALAQVINAASLAYAPFVSSTLGMTFKIYMSDAHEPEGGSLHNVNIRADLPAYQAICRILDAVINVLGPDLQEASSTQALVFNAVHELFAEDDDGIRVEAIKCMQHLLMFAPEHVAIPELVLQFREYLTSPRRPLKIASINALYQLVQKDALFMSKVGGDRLVEVLFAMLDSDPSIEGVRSVITSWLRQTAIYNPSAWIDLCQRIMSRTSASQRAADATAKNAATNDDEGESLNVNAGQDSSGGSGHLASRWRTQLFALQCLHTICSIVATSGRREHLDISYARAQGVATAALLVSRVPDLIKMAFTASAAHVTEIRLEGLVVLRDVIEAFSKSPDPEYESALLLEQHQAPITAALTPAFSSDSTPDILASAVGACAVFVGSGVVKDVSRMGRILKLLTSALEQSRSAGTLSLGDAGELSPNASVMLRIATLSAWAELRIASLRQSYLEDVLKPYHGTLASLWVASLRDYASIRADSEIASQDTPLAVLDSSNASLGRDVLLPYYLEAWPVLLHAVATTMEAHDPHILASMDGQEIGTVAKPSAVRTDPTAFFFIIFGLAFEALAESSAEAGASSAASRSTARIALMTLKNLVKPEYAGKAPLDGPIFDELSSLFYRMAMTEPPEIQILLLRVLSDLVTSQAPNMPSPSAVDDPFSPSLPQTQCLRLSAFVLRHAIPSGQEGAFHDASTVGQRTALINAAFEAFSSIGATFGHGRREELRGVAVALYAELLKDEKTEFDLVGPTLQSLKTVLEPPSPVTPGYSGLIHGLLSGCLLNIDEMQGREGAISVKKIKSNLLASVIVLTTIPPTMKIGRAVLERACFLISSKLGDTGDISLTAAQCARTLVGAAASGHANLRACAPILLPGMVEYVAKVAAGAGDAGGAVSDAHAAGIGEVWKAFSALLACVPDEHRAPVLCVFLPTIALLLEPAQAPPPPLHTLAVGQLLALATAAPAAFKDATGRLDGGTRDALEASVRGALGTRAGAAGAQSAKPQISLRSF